MLLDDVATYLAAQSTALTVGATGNLLKGILLDDIPVDTCIALYEQAGLAAIHTMSTSGSGTVVTREAERPGLQVISRSTSYQTARNRAETVFRLLDGYTGGLPTSTGVTYHSIDAVQSPFSIGRDRNQRHLISTNYLVVKGSS